MLKIGLIDSGLGGISVLKGLIDGGIEADYYYLYDNKYHPYGQKTQSELVAIGYAGVQKLLEYDVDIIIIACNTLTSRAANKLRSMFDIPIIGVEPPIKPATYECKNILLLATPSTVKSDRVADMINCYTNKNFYFPDMSKLAKLVEDNYNKKQVIYRFLTENLAKYEDIDGVVLGCTHYNFVKEEISKVLPSAKIFCNIDGVVKRTKYIISKCNFDLPRVLGIKIFCTGEELPIEKKYFLRSYLDFGVDFFEI